MTAPARIDRTSGIQKPISVLIVDDSAVARAAMSRIVVNGTGLLLAAALDSATAAITWVASHRADVILLDIEMPGRSGLSALPDLLAAGRGAQVLIVSSTAREGAEATIRALSLGAADTLAKPTVGHLNQAFGAVLVDRIQRLGHAREKSEFEDSIALRPWVGGPISLLAIGSSTGGLRALSDFFEHFPADFSAPILITQHLPAAFMPFFADQISVMSGRPTFVATDSMAVVPGTIIVAPGDGHLIIERSNGQLKLAISRETTPNRCCPSVDPMLVSASQVLGSSVTAVILSGMGRDGLAGAQRLVDAGGAVLVQNRETSTVWGMPGSVAQAGLASYMGSPGRIAEQIARRGAR